MPGQSRHVLRRPGGGYFKVAQQTPNSGYSAATRDPVGDCVPCGCTSSCSCSPPGSRYDFTPRPLRDGIDTLNISIDLPEAFTEVEFDNETIRVEIDGPTIIDFATLAPQIDQDFSYKGRCGFGTQGVRDTNPAGDWSDIRYPWAMIGNVGTFRSPFELSDPLRGRFMPEESNWNHVVRLQTIPVRITRTDHASGQVEVLEATSTIEVWYRFHCDSTGFDWDREGIEQRLSSLFESAGPADEFVPGATLEFVVGISEPEYPDGAPGGYRPGFFVSGHPDYQPSTNYSVGGEGRVTRVGVLLAGFQRVSFISGQTRMGITTGELPTGVVTGSNPAYPASPTIEPGGLSELVQYGPLQRSAQIDRQLRMTLVSTARTTRRLQASIEPGGAFRRIESFVDIDSYQVNVTHEVEDVDIGSERSSPLKLNDGWSAGIDSDGVVPDDAVVAVFRLCGSACDDKFIEAAPPNTFTLGAHIEHSGDLYRFTGLYDFIETPDDDLIEDGQYAVSNEQCSGEETWPIAVSCDGSETLTFDPAERPLNTNSCLRGETRFTPTGGRSDLPPTPGLIWEEATCPPDDNVYRLNFCRSTREAFSHRVTPQGQVIPLTIGYTPGEGMAPGQGFCLFNYRPPGEDCVFLVAGQPTDELLEEMPDIVVTSINGNSCRNIPTRIDDPRPGCNPQDAGGGGGPTSSPTSTSPNDQRIVDHIMQGFDCSSCG